MIASVKSVGKKKWLAPKHDPMPEDVAKEIKSDARHYLNLDIAYVAGTFTLITALKFKVTSLPELVVSFSMPAYAFMAILLIDTFTFTMARNHLFAGKFGTQAEHPIWLVRFLGTIEPYLHAGLIIFLAGAAMGFSSGWNDNVIVFKAQARLQTEISLYKSREGHYPSTLAELLKEKPSTAETIKALGNTDYEYTQKGDGYELRFAPRGHKAGTNDDTIATPDFDLQKTVDALEKE